ncbi:hypothetical protein CCR91_01570 [Thiorhodovibrio winogradskyi]|nr:hypothetical protein [Thiorhodovibrio winogradskyi]
MTRIPPHQDVHRAPGSTGGSQTTAANCLIASDRIKVVYRFENRSGHPVEALVAFPLPDIAPGDPHEAAGTTPSELAALSFRTEVDGQPVTYQSERRAFACRGGGWIDTGAAEQRCCADYDWDTQSCTPARGTPEITDTLARLGLLDLLEAEPVQARLNSLSPSARQELLELGTVRQFGGELYANWVQRIRHYRRQTFPADRPLEVGHRYEPVPGGSVWGPSDIGGLGTVWAVRHVLTTANTWTGAIERFSLTITPSTAAQREVIVVAGLDDLHIRVFDIFDPALRGLSITVMVESNEQVSGRIHCQSLTCWGRLPCHRWQ